MNLIVRQMPQMEVLKAGEMVTDGNLSSGIQEDFPKEVMFGLEDGLTRGKSSKTTRSREQKESVVTHHEGKVAADDAAESQGPSM